MTKQAKTEKPFVTTMVDLPDDLVRQIMEVAAKEYKGKTLSEVVIELTKRGLINARLPDRINIAELNNMVDRRFDSLKEFEVGHQFSTPDLFELDRFHPTDAKLIGKRFAEIARNSNFVKCVGRTQANLAIYERYQSVN